MSTPPQPMQAGIPGQRPWRTLSEERDDILRRWEKYARELIVKFLDEKRRSLRHMRDRNGSPLSETEQRVLLDLHSTQRASDVIKEGARSRASLLRGQRESLLQKMVGDDGPTVDATDPWFQSSDGNMITENDSPVRAAYTALTLLVLHDRLAENGPPPPEAAAGWIREARLAALETLKEGAYQSPTAEGYREFRDLHTQERFTLAEPYFPLFEQKLKHDPFNELFRRARDGAGASSGGDTALASAAEAPTAGPDTTRPAAARQNHVDPSFRPFALRDLSESDDHPVASRDASTIPPGTTQQPDTGLTRP